jgi:hypothetical protein
MAKPAEDSASPKTVEAWPTKSFFVDMLTRDISVMAAILDLCDNALGRTFELAQSDPSSYVLDSKSKSKPFRPFRLHLEVTPSAITIEDNCGGIPLDLARHEIFRLGRDASEPVHSGLSVYGIGMKRAFFKLADDVSLRSSAGPEWFEIAFNVSDWKAKGDDHWNLEFNRFGTRDRPSSIPKSGTRIELKTLLDGAKALIGSSTFQNDLRDRLQSTYSLFVAYGLDLRLNGKKVNDSMPALASDQLKPARRTLGKIGKVKTVIIVGLTAKRGQADPAESGWFVYCNGRLVLEADKSRITGWGDGLQAWHSKFNRFVGFVFFDSSDGRELPWTTTKQGVVEDSDVFLKTRQEMKVQARPVLEFLTRAYPGDIPPEGVQERLLLDKRSTVSLNEVSRTDRVFAVPQSKAKTKQTVNVQYKKSVAQIELVKSRLGKKLSASEVGSRTFDYYVKVECGE